MDGCISTGKVLFFHVYPQLVIIDLAVVIQVHAADKGRLFRQEAGRMQIAALEMTCRDVRGREGAFVDNGDVDTGFFLFTENITKAKIQFDIGRNNDDVGRGFGKHAFQTGGDALCGEAFRFRMLFA